MTLRVSFIKAKRALRHSLTLATIHTAVATTPIQRTESLAARDIANAGSLSVALPDISGAFRGELASLLSYYSGRIAAAQLAGRGADVSAIVRLIVNEQNVAVRELMDRWQTATRRQQEEGTSKAVPQNHQG